MTVVAVLNQKGGVGKTTVTLGLTSAAWAAGHRALVVDLDPQASATWGVGVEPAEVELGAAEVLLDKRAGLAAKAIRPSAWEGVDVLPMRSDPLHPPKDPTGADAHRRLRRALAGVVADYRWVFLDCPPELGGATRNALVAADLALVVAEPAALSVRGLAAVMTLIDDLWASDNPSLDLAGIVVNRVPAYHAEADLHVGELESLAGKRAVWRPFVPHRVAIARAMSDRYPIHGYGSRAGDALDAFDGLFAKLQKVARKHD